MRRILIVLYILLFSISCDPPRSSIRTNDSINLKAEVNDTSEILKIGDTLKVYVRVNEMVRTDMGLVTVEKVLSNSFFSCILSNIDTLTGYGQLILFNDLNAPVLKRMTKGNFTASLENSWNFNLTAPYEVEVQLIMKRKGVFVLEIQPQAGILNYNNSKKANVFVNFNVVNKHHDLLGKYLGVPYVLSLAQREQLGFGTYGFRVE
jgi:hypothetical protein